MIDRIYGQQPLRLHSLQGYVSDPATHLAELREQGVITDSEYQSATRYANGG
jgi:hypothetical protein